MKKIGFHALALALCLASGFLSQSCILSVVVPLIIDLSETTPEYNPWDYLKENCSGDGEEFTFVRKEAKPGKNLYYYTSLKLNEKFGEEKEFAVSAEQKDKRFSDVIYQTNYFPYFYEKDESEYYLDIVKNKTVKTESSSAKESRFSSAKVIMNNESRFCSSNVFTVSVTETDSSGNTTETEKFSPIYTSHYDLSQGNLIDAYIVINPSASERANTEENVKEFLDEMKNWKPEDNESVRYYSGSGIHLDLKIIIAKDEQISNLGGIDKVSLENVRESSEFCSSAEKVYYARKTELIENESLDDR